MRKLNSWSRDTNGTYLKTIALLSPLRQTLHLVQIPHYKIWVQLSTLPLLTIPIATPHAPRPDILRIPDISLCVAHNQNIRRLQIHNPCPRRRLLLESRLYHHRPAPRVRLPRTIGRLAVPNHQLDERGEMVDGKDITHRGDTFVREDRAGDRQQPQVAQQLMDVCERFDERVAVSLVQQTVLGEELVQEYGIQNGDAGG